MRSFLAACVFIITVIVTWVLMGAVLPAQTYGPPYPQGSFYQNGTIISAQGFGLVGCPLGEYLKGDGTGCGVPTIQPVIPASFFGVKCDGVTDDSVALNSIGTYALSTLPIGETLTVSFPSPSTCVHNSSITTWFVPNLHIEGNGAWLHFTGTGVQLSLSNAGAEVDNLVIRDLFLRGNPNATIGIYQGTGPLARSRIQINNLQDYTTACAQFTNAQLMDEFDVTCSYVKANAMGIPQTTTPATDFVFGGTGSQTFANNRKINVTAEGGGATGINCVQCTNGDTWFGTSEGHTGTGLILSSTSNENLFLGFDLESNTGGNLTDNNVSVSVPNVFVNSQGAQSSIWISGNPTSFGSISVYGSNGAFAGTQYTSTLHNRTFMIASNTDTPTSGVYAVGLSAWDWNIGGDVLGLKDYSLTLSGNSKNNQDVSTGASPSWAGANVGGLPVATKQTGITGSIGGSSLTAGNCSTGTATLGTSATGHPGVASASDGSVQGNYVLDVSVSGTTATVAVCAITAGTPTAKTYNVIVF